MVSRRLVYWPDTEDIGRDRRIPPVRMTVANPIASILKGLRFFFFLCSP